MNSQDIYNEKKREFNDKMTKYINNINKNNIYYKLKSTISELNEKKELYLRQFLLILIFKIDIEVKYYLLIEV